MIYRVRHRTRLAYAAPVANAQFNLRLQPATWAGQTLRRYQLTLTPPAVEQHDLSGPYWVVTTSVAIAASFTRLDVLSEFEMAVQPRSAIGAGPSLDAVRAAALAVPDISPLATAPYLFASRIAAMEDEIARWAAPVLNGEGGIVELASALGRAIHQQFTYQPGSTTSATRPIEAFHQRSGVCQDFAHVMIIALRAAGIPAAYASGYLRTRPPPGRPRLVGADAMHAWVNVWCGPDLGWVGFDPTNDCLAGDGHIQIGMGRDYADVAPIDGTFIGSAPQKLTTEVDVEPLDETA